MKLIFWLGLLGLEIRGEMALLSQLDRESPTARDALQRRCTDPGPFKMDYADYWRCSSDSMNCFTNVVQSMMVSIHSSKCLNVTCLAQADAHYAPALRKTLERSQQQSPSVADACASAKWTDEMDYVANIIMQKAKKCSVDHVALFALLDQVQKLFPYEERCILTGSSPATP